MLNYLLTFDGQTASFHTRAEARDFVMTDECIAGIESAAITLTGPVNRSFRVLRYNGTPIVLEDGPAVDVLNRMVDEFHATWFVREGVVLKPFEILREHWNILFRLFEIGRHPLMLLSPDQYDEMKDAGYGNVGRYLEGYLERVFGFGAGGPRVDATGYVHGEHGVHVAYALATNRNVPIEVLADYHATPGLFGGTQSWASAFLAMPEIRGHVSTDSLNTIARILAREGTPLNAGSVELVRQVVDRIPSGEEGSYVVVDDVLYELGALPKPSVSLSRSESGELVEPRCPLAKAIVDMIEETRYVRSLASLDKDRHSRRISQREYESSKLWVERDYETRSYSYGNKMSEAIENRQIGYLLSVLDSPDDRNRGSKKAIHQVLGVKLLGLKAAERRRTIFGLCGMNEAEQARMEQVLSEQADARRRKQDADDARTRASRVNYRMDTGEVIDGAVFLERKVSEGYIEIREHRRGATKRYTLANPTTNLGYRIAAKNGTVDYARVLVEQLT